MFAALFFSNLWGRTGFDGHVGAGVARRGPRLASLKNPGKNIKANEELALAA